MDLLPHAVRQPNGDLLIPAATAEVLEEVLRRLQQDLGNLHGRSVSDPVEMESRRATAYRQDSVDQLSAAAGVDSHVVQPRQRPDTYRLADSSEPLDSLKRLAGLLFGESSRP